ncbi:MAG: FAD:protein FMN transferase [Isosphaeraceae bacterium]
MPSRDRVSRRNWLLRPSGEGRPEPAPAGTGSGDLLRARRRAMGTHFDIRLPAQLPGAIDLANRALDVIDRLEDQLTIYRDDSEVAALNRSAHLGPIEVEPGLFDLLARAEAIGQATEGAYDLTTGALSEAWGFFKGPRKVPEPEALADARARTGRQHLRLDPASRTVEFDRPGIVINLGSIGKGYALDRAAEVIASHWWPTGALIHGGQSSVVAIGSPPWDFGGRWEVGLRNPFDPERPLGTFRMRNRGMGTSGDTFQRFEAHGRRYGHILDPRTGEPAADGPAGVTVLAPTAAEADALSTAFYLLGPRRSAALIERHYPDVSALFLLEPAGDDRPRAIPIRLGPPISGPTAGCGCWRPRTRTRRDPVAKNGSRSQGGPRWP